MRASDSPPVRPMQLASHVRACLSDGQVILLDLRRNRYLGVGGRCAVELAGVIDGWPVAGPGRAGTRSVADIKSLTEPLWSQGLLTDRTTARESTADIEPATASLEAEEQIASAIIGPRRACSIIQGTVSAAWWLRWRTLGSIAQAVAGRRHRLAPMVDHAAGLDSLRDAVAAYEKLRPLVLTTHDRCLHDSLALVAFLAHERMFPRWVIGVQTNPFGAHSWVQSGAVVLNDQHERVSKFKPLLVV